MVNYVNTVFVGNDNSRILTAVPTTYDIENVGKFLIMDAFLGVFVSATGIVNADAIKIGMITATPAYVKGVKQHVIKWSNVIKRNNIKSYHAENYADDTKDVVVLDFSTASATAIAELAKGNRRVVVRITNKDTETRYRKWTDSFEYVTAVGDTATTIAQGLADEIAKNYKRARVTATAASGKLTLTALDYDDDDAVDTINWAKQVRFSANCYYTNPEAAGFASKNKYTINGLTIVKTPGKIYTGSAKLVRDREAWAMGYQGILNRGDGTWPIIKPGMMTDITAKYDTVTIEFETMYRAADDIQRHTKEAVEIYEINANGAMKAAIEAWLGGVDTGVDTSVITFPTTDADA